MQLRVTMADVDRIVAEKNRALRNLQITVAYGRMADDFVDRVDARNLSWCGFGTWASEGVGAAIRHRHSDRKLVLKVMKSTMRTRFRILARTAAQAFAVGNRSVFDHIGRGFAGFHAAIDEGTTDTFLADLERRHGNEPVPRGVHVDVELPLGLADGFRHYAEVGHTRDEWQRAQLVAAGNLTLAYVEQLRLQRPIRRAFGSPLPRGMIQRRFPRRAAARFFTETAMELQVGSTVYKPRQRLPAQPHGHHWPIDLEVLDPGLFEDFEGFVVERSRAPQSKDWTDLGDRLRYIGALMRSRQQARELFTGGPFSPAERDEIWAGRIPPALKPKELR